MRGARLLAGLERPFHVVVPSEPRLDLLPPFPARAQHRHVVERMLRVHGPPRVTLLKAVRNLVPVVLANRGAVAQSPHATSTTTV